ncbi:Decarbamoylnovobiocin carbamoyltransferase [Aliarcobacter thereius]|uniref:Decarbamoylnovobiocin carbamoyltransferase n=1 Tax=Aliarcobacter thereius TaxID=544718 RepID=A0A1C0B5N7_9BACT|nr:carbamoyltransferase C-terminal domain-containing protein [Aliarcobacter thereius]OCL98216.1 Decarbamoylnovobiocin carbamoyltransferase [Aliarcobacter thereius]
MITVGIHFGHDSSLSIVKDEEIILSVEEERFTRIKTYRGFPFGGLEYAKKQFNIELKDANKIIIAGTNILEELTLAELKKRFGDSDSKLMRKLTGFITKDTLEDKENYFYKKMKSFGVDKSKIVFVDHHLLHTASAYFQSPFDDALIVTSDGKGDSTSSAIYTYENNKFIKHIDISALSSLGQMYSAVTMYLGFKAGRHEGKITGLAAYGDEHKLSPFLMKLFTFDEEKGIYKSKFEEEVLIKSIDEIFTNFNHNIIKKNNISKMNNSIAKQYETIFALYLKYFDTVFKNEKKEDIAAAVQYILEKIIIEFISFWIKKLDKKYICLAGGVFSNVKLNQRILNIAGVENIFVQPAMGDSGLSLGGALLAYSELENKNIRKAIYSVYKGPSFSSNEIEIKLKNTNLKYRKYDNLYEQSKEVAKLIKENNLVGIFNGRMEFGPRALGARTVMISPVDKTINDTANKRFNRTEFMPFAPVVLDKYAKDYFVGYKEEHLASEFMTITYDVINSKAKEIEAVVHVDNTARPQVIKKEKNLLYYMIIEEFYKLTGVPIVVNTSFNAHEEPILHNIDNAINALNNDIIDYLCIENFIVRK